MYRIFPSVVMTEMLTVKIFEDVDIVNIKT